MHHSHDTEKHLTLSINKSKGSREICSITERVKDRTGKLYTFSQLKQRLIFRTRKHY